MERRNNGIGKETFKIQKDTTKTLIANFMVVVGASGSFASEDLKIKIFGGGLLLSGLVINNRVGKRSDDRKILLDKHQDNLVRELKQHEIDRNKKLDI